MVGDGWGGGGQRPFYFIHLFWVKAIFIFLLLALHVISVLMLNKSAKCLDQSKHIFSGHFSFFAFQDKTIHSNLVSTGCTYILYVF